MLRIAFCDDMERDRANIMNKLTQIEEKWGEKFIITSFASGEDLCKGIMENHYDVILLDIIMEGIDGIETATRIRTMGEESLIIFISSFDERIRELFDFRTIAFIDKPVDAKMLEIALEKAYEIIKKNNEVFFSFNKNGSVQYLPVNDIIYFESKRNKISIYTNKETETFYGTLSGVWEQIEAMNQFVMTHRSFIFNLKYITVKSEKIIIKDTGEEFSIGEKHKADTQERYKNYIEKWWK